jgi:hypothetical protein
MGYRLLADAAMGVHFGFLAYVIVGGFLAWRWPRAIWPHLVLAGYGGVTIALHLNCPLTYVQDWARRQAGEPGLSHGFVDQYLTGVLYPQRFAGLVEVLMILAVVVAWGGVVVRRARLRSVRRQKRDHPGPPAGRGRP